MAHKILQSATLVIAICGSLPLLAQTKTQGPNGVYFEETFFPVYVSRNDTESPAGGSATKKVPTQTGWGIDTHTTLGYIWNKTLLGITYNMYSVSSSRPRTSDYEGLNESTKKDELGITLGFFLGHVRLTYTHILSANKTFTQKYTDPTTGVPTVDETRKNSGGAGFLLGVGYDFALGAGFSVSPTLLYRNISYSKQSYEVRTGTGSPYPMTTLETKALDSELNPMVTFSYYY